MRDVYTTYCIKDPDTSQVVYVGQTLDFQKRKKSHLTLRERPRIGSTNIKVWLFDKLSEGKLPIIEALEECHNKEMSLISESSWIARFAIEGKGSAILNKWREHKLMLKQGAVAWKIAQRRAAFPTAHGKPWDESSNQKLRRLVKNNETIESIASALGRTRRAIRLQILRLELRTGEDKSGDLRPKPFFPIKLDFRTMFNLIADTRLVVSE